MSNHTPSYRSRKADPRRVQLVHIAMPDSSVGPDPELTGEYVGTAELVLNGIQPDIEMMRERLQNVIDRDGLADEYHVEPVEEAGHLKFLAVRHTGGVMDAERDLLEFVAERGRANLRISVEQESVRRTDDELALDDEERETPAVMVRVSPDLDPHTRTLVLNFCDRRLEPAEGMMAGAGMVYDGDGFDTNSDEPRITSVERIEAGDDFCMMVKGDEGLLPEEARQTGAVLKDYVRGLLRVSDVQHFHSR
jgi:hypothetical protein